MGLWSSAAFCFFLINGIRGEINVGDNENFLRKSQVASPERFLAALSDTGTFVFSGLGEDFVRHYKLYGRALPIASRNL